MSDLYECLQAAREETRERLHSIRRLDRALGCPTNLTGVHIYRREGEDPDRAYCACGDSRLRDGVPIDLQSERERRRG